MRLSGFLLFILSGILVTCAKPISNVHHYIYLVNNTDKPIYIGSGVFEASENCVLAHSSDSVLAKNAPNIWYTQPLPRCWEWYLKGKGTLDIFDGVDFVHNTDQYTNEWSGATKEYYEEYALYEKEHTLITLWFDLNDLEQLNWRFTFPPTEQMLDMGVILGMTREEVISKYGISD